MGSGAVVGKRHSGAQGLVGLGRAAAPRWAVQQRRASAVTRTTVSTSGNVDWNAHMTQRRITDNPAAFQSGHAAQ